MLADPSKKKKHAAGLALIFVTAIIWVVSSFISQRLVQPGADHKQAVPPFLLTYLATSLFTLYLPFVYGRLLIINTWRAWTTRREQDGSATERLPLQQAAEREAEGHLEQGKQAHKQAFYAALWATPLWFFAQYAFNSSLALTSVTSNTILSSTSSLFTFGMAVLVLHERFTSRKLACILLCILGTALFTFADTERPAARHDPGLSSLWGAWSGAGSPKGFTPTVHDGYAPSLGGLSLPNKDSWGDWGITGSSSSVSSSSSSSSVSKVGAGMQGRSRSYSSIDSGTRGMGVQKNDGDTHNTTGSYGKEVGTFGDTSSGRQLRSAHERSVRHEEANKHTRFGREHASGPKPSIPQVDAYVRHSGLVNLGYVPAPSEPLFPATSGLSDGQLAPHRQSGASINKVVSSTDINQRWSGNDAENLRVASTDESNDVRADGSHDLASNSTASDESGCSKEYGADQAADPLLGDFLVLISSALYGAYTIVIKLQMPGEEADANVALFFGYLGLLSTVLLAPVVLVLVASGIVSLVAIPKEVYLVILLEGLLDYVLSDYLWARAVLLIGPTVATLGLSIQIPIAGIAELLVGAEHIQWLASASSISLALLGTLCILAGFVGINVSGLVTPTTEAPPEFEDSIAPGAHHDAHTETRHLRQSSTGGESLCSTDNELGSFRVGHRGGEGRLGSRGSQAEKQITEDWESDVGRVQGSTQHQLQGDACGSGVKHREEAGAGGRRSDLQELEHDSTVGQSTKGARGRARASSRSNRGTIGVVRASASRGALQKGRGSSQSLNGGASEMQEDIEWGQSGAAPASRLG